MFGFPGETREEMDQTIRFAKQLSPTYASFHVVEPYPGTVLAEDIKDHVKGEFFPFYYDFPGVDLKAMQRKAFLSFYLRPYYLMKRALSGGWGMLIRQMKIFSDYLR